MASAALVPVLVAGGGVAYIAATTQPPAGPPAYPNPNASLPTSGQTIGDKQTLPTKRTVSAISIKRAAVGVNLIGTAPKGTAGVSLNPDYVVDPELAQKLAELEAYAQQQFNNMNEVAKAQAADTLNKELKLDPPLTGHEDWKTVVSVVGGAAGAALGGAIAGPIGAKIGALVGAYLGAKLGDLLAKNYEELKAWAKEKWGDLKEWVGDAVEEVGDALEDAYDETKEFISGLNPF